MRGCCRRAGGCCKNLVKMAKPGDLAANPRHPYTIRAPRRPAVSTTTAGYLVRRLQEAPTVPCPCGQSTRPLTRLDTPTCNLHVTFIKDSLKHFHKESTEVYFILDGQGKMELNDD